MIPLDQLPRTMPTVPLLERQDRTIPDWVKQRARDIASQPEVGLDDNQARLVENAIIGFGFNLQRMIEREYRQRRLRAAIKGEEV